MPPSPPKICAEVRRALVMLSESPEGCTESLMLLNGFRSALIAVLLGAGLATEKAGCALAESGQFAVTLINITDAGRVVLEQK